jgi:hypothetical protein
MTVEEVSGGVVKLTQADIGQGELGNTTIDMSGVATTTASGFSGGVYNTGAQPATATITTTGMPGNSEIFTLTDADGLVVNFIFNTGVATVDGSTQGVADLGRAVIIGVSGAAGHAASVGDRIRSAISASTLNMTVEEVSSGVIKLTQNTPGADGNTTIDMSGVATTTATNFSEGKTRSVPFSYATKGVRLRLNPDAYKTNLG